MADQDDVLREQITGARSDFRELLARMVVAEELARLAMFFTTNELEPEEHAEMLAWLRDKFKPPGSAEFQAAAAERFDAAMDRLAKDHAGARAVRDNPRDGRETQEGTPK